MTIAIIGIIAISALMIMQGIMTMCWMLSAWHDPKRAKRNKFPTRHMRPYYSFTALLPARDEAAVIQDTVRAIHRMRYPASRKEVIIICRRGDAATIAATKEVIREVGSDHARLVVFDGLPVNKAHALNVGLHHARNDIVAVFDAEDEPHPALYRAVNTVMRRSRADVVQSGIQLMNYRAHWFAALNVLEYYFWFKSTLHFFARHGFILLGGNTVFLKRAWLTRMGGWDEQCLTEDADIGIRMSVAGAKLRVVYDERLVTREEVPTDAASFVRQRARWDQGFAHVCGKGDWIRLSKYSQRLLAAYALVWPVVQGLLFLYIPAAIAGVIFLELPVPLAMFATLPLYIVGFQQIICIAALYEFNRDYQVRMPWWYPLTIVATFYPYLVLLGCGTFRAIVRLARKDASWEKTAHHNAHRMGHSAV